MLELVPGLELKPAKVTRPLAEGAAEVRLKSHFDQTCCQERTWWSSSRPQLMTQEETPVPSAGAEDGEVPEKDHSKRLLDGYTASPDRHGGS